jgi:hypothetical protein
MWEWEMMNGLCGDGVKREYSRRRIVGEDNKTILTSTVPFQSPRISHVSSRCPDFYFRFYYSISSENPEETTYHISRRATTRK